jgi:hypothetical protein
MKILKHGDRLEAICERCEDLVSGTYRYREVPLKKTGVRVHDILVGVCDACDEIISIPAQSTPKLKDARERQIEKVPLRYSREMDDLLHMVAGALDARPEVMLGLLTRYYLRAARKETSIVRRAIRASQLDFACKSLRVRGSVNVELDDLVAVEQAANHLGLGSRSDLIRGLIVVAGEDVLENKAPMRRRRLSEMAPVA